MSGVKDLPKIDNSLKGELLKEHNLKETQVFVSSVFTRSTVELQSQFTRNLGPIVTRIVFEETHFT